MTFSRYSCPVEPEWIDYNGHLSEAYYVLVFGFATDTAMAALGLGPEYRADSGCSLYTVEAHIRYLQEVGPGARLEVTTEIIGAAGKKLHLAHRMESAGTLLATEEILCLHVDQRQGQAVPLPDATLRVGQPALAPAPEWSGRRIAM